jgi:hypothetical protein
MRLSMLDGGHFKLRHRILMKIIHLSSKHRAPDVVKLHYFNFDRVGKHMGASFQAAMRGPSEWSVLEREIMAAFVSNLNQCTF